MLGVPNPPFLEQLLWMILLMVSSEYWAYRVEIDRDIKRRNMDQVRQINDKMK